MTTYTQASQDSLSLEESTEMNFVSGLLCKNWSIAAPISGTCQ